MRYFKTELDNFLYWIWDERAEVMYFTGFVNDPLNEWNKITGQEGSTPDTLNKTYGELDDYQPGDAYYAYETDENWNRL